MRDISAPEASAAPSAGPAGAPTSAPPPGYTAVDSGGQMQSGEALLVEAYIVIWVLLFAFIAIAWQRTRRAENKIAELEKAIEKAKAVVVPSTKRSASEPKNATEGS